MMEEQPYFVVAIACSAGGFGAVRDILAELPANFPAPIIIAQHRGNRSPDVLIQLLSAKTKLRVKSAAPLEYVYPGWVYVCPPGNHVEMASDQMLRAWEGPHIDFVRPSCDLLFKSVAATLGERGVCVVLSGCGDDGAMATRHVRRAGGYVIAQDEASAAYSGMPIAAMELGRVDLVLPLRNIAFALCQLVQDMIASN